MTEEAAMARCPQCNRKVKGDGSDDDAVSCDGPPNSDKNHWWHRACLEADSHLATKTVPITAALMNSLHNKKFTFVCHICDMTRPPLPVQLVIQGAITREDLIKVKCMTQEVEHYLCEYRAGNLKVGAIPSVSFVKDPVPPVPVCESSSTPSTSSEVQQVSSEASADAEKHKSNLLAIQEVTTDTNPNEDPPLGGLREGGVLHEGMLHFGTPGFPLVTTSEVFVPPNTVGTSQPTASFGANTHTVSAGGGLVGQQGTPQMAPYGMGLMPHGPMGPPQPYQMPTQMPQYPMAPYAPYQAPTPFADPSSFMQMMIQQQERFMTQQQQMFERMDEQRRRDTEANREFVERVLRTQQPAPPTHSGGSSRTQNPPVASGYAKPKFKMPTFDGDILKWQSYWDTFLQTVHNNPNFSEMEKLHALFESLQGRAKKAVENYSLEVQNYPVVIDVLKDRFDDKVQIKNAHLQALMNVSSVQSTHPSQLQTFLDSVNLHSRAIITLENGNSDMVDMQCVTIVPCLFEKLPLVIRSQMFDNATHGGPQVRTHLSHFRVALQARVKVQESIHGSSWLSASGQASGSGSGAGTKTPTHNPPNRHGRGGSGSMLLAPETKLQSGSRPGSGKKPPDTSQPKKIRCTLCESENEHRTFECPVFNTSEARLKKLGNVCIICLKKDHKSRDCPVKGKRKCYTCGKDNHHSILCFQLLASLKQKVQNSDSRDKKSPGKKDLAQLTVDESSELAGVCVPGEEDAEEGEVDRILCEEDPDVAMQSAVVTVRNPENHKKTTANVLYDCGCKRTYISQKIASLICLKARSKRCRRITTFNATKSRKVQAGITNIQLQGQDGSYIELMGNIIDYIANSVYMEGFLLSDMDKTRVKKLKMADPRFCDDRMFEIDIVIGNDFYAMMLGSKKVQLQKSGVFLMDTQLGWVTSGVIKECARLTHSENHADSENLALLLDDSKPVVLEDDAFSPLEDLWKFETLGIKDPKSSDTSDHIALKQFNDTVQYEDGRVAVTWLKKPGIEKLPTNYVAALVRLKSLLRTLGKNSEYHEKYIKNMADWLARDMIEMVTPENDNPDNLKHYIAHLAVFKSDSKTTKMRVCLDASTVTKIGKCLNDYLYRGPNLLPDLGGLLLRFRHDPIGVISDIEKAFLQLLLQESERDLTRFLWLKDPTKLTVENNIQIYRFKRVPFGFKTSPFLLSGSIWDLLDQAGGPEIPIAEKVRQNIYVDNVITGVQSVSEAQEFYKTSKKLFAHGSMNLREWNSNSTEFMASIPEHDRDERTVVKVLGMSWDKSEDSLSIAMKDLPEFLKAQTKREILAAVASIFDPLGLLSCLKVQGLIFLQDLWREHKGWDDPLSESTLAKWRELCEKFRVVPEIKIPRFLCTISNSPVVLCVFSDASAVAFSCNIYVRTENDEGIKIGLVFSKARLCPVSGLSVPRSELMGTFIGTKCRNYVKEQLGVEVAHTYLWTDSQCVLGWIQNEARDQGVFVANRITQVLNNEDITFSYIPTDQNPADLCTKSRLPGFEMPWDLWFEGPPWLKLPIPQWPKFETFPPPDAPTLLAGESNSKNLRNSLDLEAVVNLERFGSRSFMSLVRVTAWVLRFVRKVKEKIKSRKNETRVIQTRSKTRNQTQKSAEGEGKLTPLTNHELKSAQNLWIESVQRHSYPELFTQKIRTSNFAQNLRLSLGDDHLLRSQGRFAEAELMGEDAKYPILLPPKSEITRIIISSYHKQYLHSGVNYTLSHIRSDFWIPQGRKIVATVLKSCAHCKKFHATPFARPPMPNLPKERVSESPPFTYTGVDYFGALLHKTEQGEGKAWVVLFTCFAIRAVHLELVPDMTGENLLCALRRFVARRGKPKTIYSDNAKQFKIMKKILKQTEQNPVYDFIKSEGIVWKFIPELSPWQGAAWERLVGVAKSSLKKALGKTILNFEQLRTVLVEVEDIVNSRPLTFVNMSSGDDDMKIITPQNFLSAGRRERLPIIPEDDPEDPEFLPTQTTQTQIVKKWKHTQFYLNKFWELWQKQYLLSLRERHASDKFPKIKSEVFHAPEVGEIVLVKSENVPRGLWKLGRVVEVHQGRDSLVRSVKVKMASSKEPITRPVSLLFPLEVQSNTDASSDNFSRRNIGSIACDLSFHVVDSPSSPIAELNSEGLVRASDNLSPCVKKADEQKSTVVEKFADTSEGVRLRKATCGLCNFALLALIVLCVFHGVSSSVLPHKNYTGLHKKFPLRFSCKMEEIDLFPTEEDKEDMEEQIQDVDEVEKNVPRASKSSGDGKTCEKCGFSTYFNFKCKCEKRQSRRTFRLDGDLGLKKAKKMNKSSHYKKPPTALNRKIPVADRQSPIFNRVWDRSPGVQRALPSAAVVGQSPAFNMVGSAHSGPSPSSYAANQRPPLLGRRPGLLGGLPAQGRRSTTDPTAPSVSYGESWRKGPGDPPKPAESTTVQGPGDPPKPAGHATGRRFEAFPDGRVNFYF